MVEITLHSHGETRVFRPAPTLPYLPTDEATDTQATAVRRLIRMLLWLEDPHCRSCGRVLSWRRGTIDHQHPKSRGGDDRPSNLSLFCKPCNEAKGSMTAEEWQACCPPPQGEEWGIAATCEAMSG